MLARSSAQPRAGIPLPAAKEGPSAHDLMMDGEEINASDDSDLFRLFFKNQAMRVNIFAVFDDAFEFLVTDGKADEYPGLCDRFKEKFAALDKNVERIAAKLPPMLSNMMLAVVKEEQARVELKLEEQVLRQHLSTTALEDEERPSLKKKTESVTANLAARAAKVEESLEELRAELADL